MGLNLPPESPAQRAATCRRVSINRQSVADSALTPALQTGGCSDSTDARSRARGARAWTTASLAGGGGEPGVGGSLGYHAAAPAAIEDAPRPLARRATGSDERTRRSKAGPNGVATGEVGLATRPERRGLQPGHASGGADVVLQDGSATVSCAAAPRACRGAAPRDQPSGTPQVLAMTLKSQSSCTVPTSSAIAGQGSPGRQRRPPMAVTV